MDENADRVQLPSTGELRVRAAQARAAANLSEAEFTQRLRAYGLDFRQENVAQIELGLRPMTLEEALVIGDVLQIEIPTSAGPIQVELANASFARDLDQAQKQWHRFVKRLFSLQKATDDLVDSFLDIRLRYIEEVRTASGTTDQELLSLARSLIKKASATKNVFDVLQEELDDPDWQDGLEYFKLSRIVKATPQRVFEAMTDPRQVALWWGPEGFTCPEVTLDARVGGAYRIAMQPPEGELFHVAGEYREVQPPSRLAYTFRWEPPDPDDRETVARLTLHARDGETEVALTQGPFATDGRRELHKAGWTDTLARLASHLASA
jgi:uncharacterized protein YndB with AHSA1/START domain